MIFELFCNLLKISNKFLSFQSFQKNGYSALLSLRRIISNEYF
nr:MAG TPA: hypothetical protein [Siphoviridae sp. ctwYi19]